MRDGHARTVGERDEAILACVAKHPFVLTGHVRQLLGVSQSLAYDHLVGLAATGLVRRDRMLGGEGDAFRITPAGLSVLGSALPAPGFDSCYRHDIGVVWLWLAASSGSFGPAELVFSEREMPAAGG